MPVLTGEVSLKEQTIAQVLIGGDSEELQKDSKTSGSFYKLVRNMRKDPTISISRELSIAAILAAQWNIEEFDNAPPGAREHIEKAIMPLRMHMLRTSLFGCVDFGWQPYEKVFKLDEATKLITIAKLKPLLQDITTIIVDPVNGSFNGFKNKDTTLSLQDSLLLNIRVEGTNWYGDSMSAVAQKPFDEWNICNDANVRYDQKLAGAHWVVHYPVGQTMLDGALTDNFVIAQAIIAKLQSSGCIIVPRQLKQTLDDLSGTDDGWEIELKSAYPTSNVAFVDRMKYLDALKARAYGLPERAVLEGQFGTKAEAEAHADFAITNMELRHQEMVQQYNWHLVNHLLRVNWGVEFENTVAISVAPITDITIQYLRSLFDKLMAIPESAAEQVKMIDSDGLRDRLGIPTRSADQVATEANTAPAEVAASFLSKIMFAETNAIAL